MPTGSARCHFDDLQGERRYINWLSYGQSKLPNLMFCFELQKRATAADTNLESLAAHPGYARTNLQFAGPHLYEQWIMRISNPILGQSAEMGALPTLFAATAPDLPGGAFIGPDGFMEQRGHPHIVTAAGRAYRTQKHAALYETTLFRIAQESLTNAARYAHPQCVWLSLTQNQQAICLQIRDDGIGFDASQKFAGLGIAGMRERASLLEGSLTIVSQPGQGTTVEVFLPLSISSMKDSVYA